MCTNVEAGSLIVDSCRDGYIQEDEFYLLRTLGADVFVGVVADAIRSVQLDVVRRLLSNHQLDTLTLREIRPCASVYELKIKFVRLACEDGTRVKILEFLLRDLSFPVYFYDGDNTDCFLRIASSRGHLDIVKCLLQYGHFSPWDQDMAFVCAAGKHRVDIVREFLRRGEVDPCAKGYRALKWATGASNYYDTVCCFLRDPRVIKQQLPRCDKCSLAKQMRIYLEESRVRMSVVVFSLFRMKTFPQELVPLILSFVEPYLDTEIRQFQKFILALLSERT